MAGGGEGGGAGRERERPGDGGVLARAQNECGNNQPMEISRSDRDIQMSNRDIQIKKKKTKQV